MAENGKWVTINGAHVFIEDGETAEEALEKLNSKKKPSKYYRVKSRDFFSDYTRIVSDADLDIYSPDDYTITEVDVANGIKEIDDMDLSQSVKSLTYKARMLGKTAEEKRFFKDYIRNRIAEHQMTLADKFLENVPEHKDISVEESVLSINLDNYKLSKEAEHDTPEYAAYTHNCQRCAQAFILRWCYGYEVTAKPSERIWNSKKHKFDITGIDTELNDYAIRNGYNELKYTRGEYNGWDRVIFNVEDVQQTLVNGTDIASEIGYPGTEDQLRWIKKKVKSTGPGSAYLCSVCWKGTRTNSGSYDAHVFCIINDGGKVKFVDPQSGEECSSYFTEKQIVPKKTEIFRADNCRLNGTMMKEVVDYEGNSK